VIGHLERPYQRLLQSGLDEGAALDKLGLTADRRDCCRTVMLTYYDVVEATLDFERANALKAPDDTSDEYVTVHGPDPPHRRPEIDLHEPYDPEAPALTRAVSRCRRDCPCCPRMDAATAAEQRQRRRIVLAR
jgi:DNA-directed RNA polymerase subunit N (RpoN/RPB10)